MMDTPSGVISIITGVSALPRTIRASQPLRLNCIPHQPPLLVCKMPPVRGLLVLTLKRLLV